MMGEERWVGDPSYELDDGCRTEGCATDEEKWNNESNIVIEKLKHEHEIEKRRAKYKDTETGSAVLSLLDLTALMGNTIFALLLDVGTVVCPGVCDAAVLIAYQPMSMAINGISTLAGIGWVAKGIIEGTNDLEYYSNSGQTYMSVSVSQDTIVAVGTNAAGWAIREPNTASALDVGVTGYDFAGLLDVLPVNTNPTVTYSSTSGFSFSWQQ